MFRCAGIISQFGMMYIRVVPGMAIFGHGHARTSPQGANERVLLTDLRSVFIFFLTLMVAFSFSIKVFKNQRGDPLVKKDEKK